MLKTTYIDRGDHKEIIEYFYNREGRDWHRHIHRNAGKAKQNIAHAVEALKEAKVFVVYEGDTPMAYFGKQKMNGLMMLVGFHINRKCRKPEFFKFFWQEVSSIMGEDYVTGIYEENVAAIKHLQRQGFKVGGTYQEGNKFNIILKMHI